MAVPTYEAMMRPTLEILADSGPQPFRKLAELVADAMQVSEQDRATSIDSGQAAYVNRVGWAVTYLVQAGAIRRPQRGVAEITDRGRALLDSVAGPISNANLIQYEEFQEFRKRSKRRTKSRGHCRGTKRYPPRRTPTARQRRSSREPLRRCTARSPESFSIASWSSHPSPSRRWS